MKNACDDKDDNAHAETMKHSIGSRVVDTVIAILRRKESSREAHGSGEIATMSLLKRRPRRDAGRKNPEGLKDSAPDLGDSEEGQSTSNKFGVVIISCFFIRD